MLRSFVAVVVNCLLANGCGGATFELIVVCSLRVSFVGVRACLIAFAFLLYAFCVVVVCLFL